MDTSFASRDLLGLLQRQIRIILFTASAVLAVAALVVFSITPLYTATALVRVDPDDKSLLTPDLRPEGSGADNARIDGEVELARSDNVLLMVIDRENLTADPEFATGKSWLAQLLPQQTVAPPDAETARLATLARFSAMVSVQRRGLTFLIAINARSEDPAKAARLANALAGAYIDSQLAAKVQSMIDAHDLLAGQLAATAGPAGDATPFTSRQRDDLLNLSQQLLAESALQLPDSRIVSEALRPGAPSWPNARLLLLLALAAGLAAGIGAAGLYERLVGGVMAEEQLAPIAGTRLAWSVPSRKSAPHQASLADAVIHAPLSAYAEAIRKIRTGIDQGLARATLPSSRLATCIAVTSTEAGEGKTTLALSLARSYAQSGRRTILIDGDLRHPALHLQLALEPSDALTRALRSDDPTVSLQDALVRDIQTGLFALIGSRNSDTATDQLITSQTFERLISAASQAFDVVILDTPSLSQAVDALYLTRRASAVVMVVKWATTSRTDLSRALLSLEPALSSGAVLIPVISQLRLPLSVRAWRHRRYREQPAGP